MKQFSSMRALLCEEIVDRTIHLTLPKAAALKLIQKKVRSQGPTVVIYSMMEFKNVVSSKA